MTTFCLLLDEKVLVILADNICFMPTNVYETYKSVLPRARVYDSYIKMTREYYKRKDCSNSKILELLSEEDRKRVYECDQHIRENIVFETKVFARLRQSYSGPGVMVSKFKGVSF